MGAIDAVGADVDVAVDAGVVLCTAPPRELWGPPGQSPRLDTKFLNRCVDLRAQRSRSPETSF